MISNEEYKPNFKRSLEKANDLLVSSNEIQSFPFSIKRLIKEKTNSVVRTFYDATTYGVNIFDFGTKDATLKCFRGKYIIFYNEKIKSNNRIRFSLGHELGHLQLQHDLDNKEMYDIYEIEANFFSAQLLMPEQLIIELQKRGQMITKENLMKWFSVSKEAAEKRLDTLRKVNFKKRSFEEKIVDESILLKYKSFIDEIAPISFRYDPFEEEEFQSIRDSWY